MSRRNRRLRSLVSGKPCIFCGGQTLATTIEHAPPIAMFEKRFRPKGFEFPACQKCNTDTSKYDQVAAMFISMAADAISGNDQNPYTQSLMKGVANNHSEVFDYISNDLRQVGILELSLDGQINEVLAVPVRNQLFRKWLNPWLAKQAVALWYYQTGNIVRFGDRVSVRWLANEKVFENGIPEGLLENLKGIGMMQSGKRELSHLFSYRYAISDDATFGAFLIVFRGSSVGFAAIAPRDVFAARHYTLEFGELFAPCTGFGLQRCIELPLAAV